MVLRHVLTSATLAFSILGAQAKNTKPNIVVILADDIAWGDVGVNGVKLIKTPHIDALANQGVNFVNGYASASVSSATRYAMLTGEYAFRRNLNILPGDAPMSLGEDNLASMLRKNGYKTSVIGKWHLGLGNNDLDYNYQIKPSPNDVGFDYSFIIPATGDRVPCVFVENGMVVNHDVSKGDAPIVISYDKKIGNDPTGFKNPEMQKLRWIEKNHSMTIVNGIARMGWMTGGYRARWIDEETSDLLTFKAVQTIAQSNYEPFFIYLASHDAHEPRIANIKHRGSSSCGVYGDVIQQFDTMVGEMVQTLKDKGVFDNTIIILSSDNGPNIKEAYDDGALENLNGHEPFAGMRGHKYGIYQGGLRVPFIVSWPEKIKKKRIEQRPVCLSNLVPTLASLLNINEYGVKDAQDDSYIYLGKDTKKENPVYLQNGNGNQFAVVNGGWKFIRLHNGKEELYKISSDMAESSNLIETETVKRNELKIMLEQFINK